ncbi:hypothetical protein F4779DRAFT_472369 [Xylariaceae sp. FL0662B]|nr:hypothetical protein F4779DRAFT_472369 [Xylariaceae sp. FL0662B]
MGSQPTGTATTTSAPLPDATAPSLILTHPTEAEKQRTWTRNHAEWGGALSLPDYLTREPYLTTIPLARDGGMTHWILTTDGSSGGDDDDDDRPVLASCESLRKRVLVASPGDGTARDALAHGVASVFTYPEYRGRGYAARMLGMLGAALRTWQRASDREVVCSALWSDIGKVFYARKGWAAFASVHVAFPTPSSSSSLPTTNDDEIATAAAAVTPITYANLPSFCARDEALLRIRVAAAARESGKTSVAFVPEHDALRWHLFRDDFITSTVFPSRAATATQNQKGAAAGVDGRRVWAVWSRNYHRDPEDAGRNTLYILRVVVEDEEAAFAGADDVVAAFAAVMRAALREARAWRLGKADLWNPTPVVRGLIERSGLSHEWVDRDVDSIPSMMWYGEEDSSEINWVANEKFCWC